MQLVWVKKPKEILVTIHATGVCESIKDSLGDCKENIVLPTQWGRGYTSLGIVLSKKQTYTKTEAYKLYYRVFLIFLPNVIKIDAYNNIILSYIPFQSWRVF